MKIKKSLQVIVIISAFSVLTGCDGNNSTTAVQTVEWYKTHEKERKEMIAKCNNNPGQLAMTPNCINAEEAASSITWGSRGVIKVKPLEFEMDPEKGLTTKD